MMIPSEWNLHKNGLFLVAALLARTTTSTTRIRKGVGYYTRRSVSSTSRRTSTSISTSSCCNARHRLAGTTTALLFIPKALPGVVGATSGDLWMGGLVTVVQRRWLVRTSSYCSYSTSSFSSQQHQQQHQQGGDYRTRQSKAKQKRDEPFHVLGISPVGETYAIVKKRFLQIALRHHPDTSEASTPQEMEQHRDIFLAARKAFESIVEGSDGLAIHRSESDQHKQEQETDDNMAAWFRDETGYDMPFVDLATMKEVAEMTDTLGSTSAGMDRDGGMWTLARMITQTVHSGGDAKDILRLESGTIRDKEIDGILRRKRRR